jgi:hypothetical protein
MSNDLNSLTVVLSLATLFGGYMLGISRDKSKTIFDKKLEIYSKVIAELSRHRYITKELDSEGLINLLAPARLLASVGLEKKIRDYYSDVTSYWEGNSEEKLRLASIISNDCMEVEQLMRKELGAGRIYTHSELEEHLGNTRASLLKEKALVKEKNDNLRHGEK